MKSAYPRKPIPPGTVFGILTVVEDAGKIGSLFAFKCSCKCGNTIVVPGSDLRGRRRLSCGCLSRRYGDYIEHMTAEKLRELVHYEPESGAFSALPGFSPDQSLREIPNGGYLHLWLRGKLYRSHRLAWLYMTGAFPSGHIDHKNGIRSDNRWSNLREITPLGNMQNMHKPASSNKTGFLGVCRSPHGKFLSYIRYGGKKRYLGTFETAEEAAEAYRQAKEANHPWWVDVRSAEVHSA